MILSFLQNKHSHYWSVIALLHLAVMGLLYYQFGLSTQNEGAKYLYEAQLLVDGHLPKTINYDGLYSGYVIYIALFLILKLPVSCIFIVTYLLSLFAYWQFYHFLKMQISNIIATIWLSLMLLSPMVLYWQFTLFSETFFIAISLLFISVLFDNKSFKITRLCVLVPLLILSRPSSVFTILVMVLYYVYTQHKITLKKSIVIFISSLLVLGVAVVCYMPLPYTNFTYEITSGAVYCGFTTLPATLLPTGKYTLLECYFYIYHQYGLSTVLKLFIQKWVSFFNITRAYYSTFHNVFNALNASFYVLAMMAIYDEFKNKLQRNKLMLSFFSIIILNSLMVAFIYNEWSERHTVEIFPYLFVMAASGLQKCYELIKK